LSINYKDRNTSIGRDVETHVLSASQLPHNWLQCVKIETDAS